MGIAEGEGNWWDSGVCVYVFVENKEKIYFHFQQPPFKRMEVSINESF